MVCRPLSPDVTGVATDTHCPQRAEREADHIGNQIIEGWGRKHHRTPEAGSPVRSRIAAEWQRAAVLRWVI